jgi:hypothetical protein
MAAAHDDRGPPPRVAPPGRLLLDAAPLMMARPPPMAPPPPRPAPRPAPSAAGTFGSEATAVAAPATAKRARVSYAAVSARSRRHKRSYAQI